MSSRLEDIDGAVAVTAFQQAASDRMHVGCIGVPETLDGRKSLREPRALVQQRGGFQKRSEIHRKPARPHFLEPAKRLVEQIRLVLIVEEFQVFPTRRGKREVPA